MRVELILPDNQDEQRAVFGVHDTHLRRLRAGLGVAIVPRQGRLIVEGAEAAVSRAVTVIERLLDLAEYGAGRVSEELAKMVESSQADAEQRIAEGAVHTERRRIVARSDGQRRYLEEIRRRSLVLGVGPAGTGKTYLAVACAVEALRQGEVAKIVLTRPAVEAGERLGFLPGDMREKVDPYLRPIYDALEDMISRRQLSHYLAVGVIEVAPLAFMRGRTLSQSFVILDEAQNTTPGQMKMLLTRLGPGSRCVVTGDLTQVDLVDNGVSGLLHATRILAGLKNVAVVHLSGDDIVRHDLVRDIVAAYERDGETKRRHSR